MLPCQKLNETCAIKRCKIISKNDYKAYGKATSKTRWGMTNKFCCVKSQKDLCGHGKNLKIQKVTMRISSVSNRFFGKAHDTIAAVNGKPNIESIKQSLGQVAKRSSRSPADKRTGAVQGCEILKGEDKQAKQVSTRNRSFKMAACEKSCSSLNFSLRAVLLK